MLKFQINKNSLISDQDRILYSSFTVEDIDFIDKTKTLVTVYYYDYMLISEGDTVIAVYDEPTMDENNIVTTKSRFREYKVEGLDTDERWFTIVADKYYRLKGSYLSKETVVTYEDKYIDKSEYETLLNNHDVEVDNYTPYQYVWKWDDGGNNLISLSEWEGLDNDYQKDAYVDCYTDGSDYISMWERFGGKEYSIDGETGEITESDPYEGYTQDYNHKILSPYVSTLIDVDEYNLLEDYEKECYEVDTYVYPGGETVETEYLYVWFSNSHYFKGTENENIIIEIDCDEITYTLKNGEYVNNYGLRFLISDNEYANDIYEFFYDKNLYPLKKYVEPVEGTYVEPLEDGIIENVDYFVARIDEAVIRRGDIVFPPPVLAIDEEEEDVEYEPTTSEDTNVTLFLKKFVTSISIPLSNEFSTDMYHEYNIKEKFVDVETKKAINDFVEMEKDVYHPVVKVGENEYKDVKEIRFNLHFREHRGDDWTASNECYWNGTYVENNELKLMNQSNNEKYGFFYSNSNDEMDKQSDLLSYLNFTNNDVKFQKNVIKKSFIRLSFYDSPRQTDQNLLHYSTIFMDAGNLFGKYTRNFLKPVENNFYYNRLLPTSLTGETKTKLEGIRVDREVYTTKSNVEDYRLSSQFSVKDRYNSLASSDGFYLYLWKDNDLGFTPSDIYLKVEFNHAGYGRTIPFMMPYDNGQIKTFADIVSDWNGDGYGIKRYLRYSYIHFKYRYDKVNERHIYYLDDEQYGDITLEEGNVLNINLWEAKVK